MPRSGFIALALMPLALGQQPECATLRVGVPIEGVIDDSSPAVETEILTARHTDAPAVGLAFRLEVEEAGSHTIELRSYFFDAYLVLRDAEGKLLAEDDDGLIGSQARLVVADLEPGQSYRVEACALHGERGRFELAFRRGEPPALSPAQRAALELDDAEESVHAIEAVEGGESEALARALGVLARLLRRRGDYAAAKPLYQRALAIRETVLGPEHPDTATSLNNLAVLLLVQGDYAAARPLYERALAISEKILGPEHPDTANSLSNLAVLLSSQSDYAAARPLYERALAIREKILGPEHPDTAESLNNLAVLLKVQGDYAAAGPLLERTLAIVEKVLGPDHPDTATVLSNLADVLEKQGDHAAARPLYERALAIAERVLGPEHPETAASLNNLAVLLQDQGDLAAARPLYERALAISERVLGPEHPDTANSLNNLARLLRAQGDLAAARPLYERALVIREKVLGPEHPNTANSLNCLAGLLGAQGDLAAARPLHERALAIREKILGPEHPDTATSLNSLAVLLDAQGDCAAARPLFERALAIREKVLGPQHPDTATSLNNLAMVLADQGESSEAWELIDGATLERDSPIRTTLASLSEGERYLYLAGLFWELELRLSLARELGEPTARRSAYDSVLAWKGRVGRMLAASRAQLVARMSEEEHGLVEELRHSQAELSRTALLIDVRDRAAHERRLAELSTERSRLERELYRRTSSDDGAAATFESVRAELGSGAALVDFLAHHVYYPGRDPLGAWSGRRMSAWITRGDRDAPIELDLGPAADIEQAIKAFLEDLVARRGMAVDDAESGEDPGATLCALLWDPLAAHLAGIETVFVSPDGALGTLPFETLPLADSSRAVERYAFVYLQDASALLAEPEARPGFTSLLSVGGVDFRKSDAWDLVEAGSSAGEAVALADAGLRGSFTDYWGRLPATEYESQVVFDLHEDAFGDDGRRLLLQGASPSEERLKHELPLWAVLHLATHGYFQPEGMPSMWEAAKDAAGRPEMRMSDEARELVGKQPGLLSGLVCAGANRGGDPDGDDGYLTAEEVGWLDLSKVELVVLSACETGLGRAQSGEGLLGLRRAFETAGAKTVISSLWSVKDESTANLMRDFYENLWLEGMGREEALRAAQLAMLRQNRIEHRADLPSTWGAFVLSGEWR